MKIRKSSAFVVAALIGIGVVIATLAIRNSGYHLKFQDRKSAGFILSELLKARIKRIRNLDTSSQVTVLGITRGGIILADIIADRLSANFEFVIGMKIGMPSNKENAIGAIMEDGTRYINEGLVNKLGLPRQYIDSEVLEIMDEIRQRKLSVLGGELDNPHCLKNRIVILVDDGAATGSTILCAARFVRKFGPKHLTIALPVAPTEIIKLLRKESDHVEVISTPKSSEFLTVGQFYHNFDPVTQNELLEIIGSYHSKK